MTMNSIFTAKLTNDIKEVPRIIKKLNLFLESHQISGWMVNAVNLAVEESLVNIINHGCNTNKLITIKVETSVKPQGITILLTDNGNPFNPLSLPHVDISKPAINASGKELGMHIVRNIMHTMWYERKDDKNIFEIRIER